MNYSLFLIVSSALWLISSRLVSSRLRTEERKSNDFSEVISCHWREFDLCAVGFASLFQNPNGLPQSDLELKRQCELLSESASCLEQYAEKCLTEQQSQLFQMFSSNSVRILHDFCQPGSELRTNYTKHVQCYREIQRKYQRTCMTDFQVGFESIRKHSFSARLELTCCNVNRLKDCIFGPLEEQCGMESEDLIRSVIESITGHLLMIPCRSSDPEGERCQSLLPKNGTKPHGSRSASPISKLIAGFTNVPSMQGK